MQTRSFDYRRAAAGEGCGFCEDFGGADPGYDRSGLRVHLNEVIISALPPGLAGAYEGSDSHSCHRNARIRCASLSETYTTPPLNKTPCGRERLNFNGSGFGASPRAPVPITVE